MKNIVIAILAWVSGIVGQTAVAKEHHEKQTVTRRNSTEIARDKSIMNSLSKAGVLKKGDNEKDTSCGGGSCGIN